MAEPTLLDRIRELFPGSKQLKQAAGAGNKPAPGPTPEDYSRLKSIIEAEQKKKEAAREAAKPAPAKALEELSRPTPKKQLVPGRPNILKPRIVQRKTN